METYGKILLIAMPVFLLLVFIEKWYAWRKHRVIPRHMDSISSLTAGVTNVAKDVLGLSVALYTYAWMQEHWALMHIRSTLLTYIIAFFALDFAGYCIHRIQHRVNIFWNGHIIHHSSEEFDLACALRQSISGFVKIFFIFLLPAALLGVPEKVIAVVAPLHLFAQFWYHTEHIGRMGFLEKIIVTPSHHRVHHAINPAYIDKNFGQIFIFWDKLFGTFQEEKKDIKTVYGITRPVSTWNPVKINFQHAMLLLKDAWRTKKITDKLRIWFMPTGWRPNDITEMFPVYKIGDVHNFEKYRKKETRQLIYWCWFQMLVLLLFVSWLFGNIAAIGSPGIFLYGGFILLYVYALTELMDRNRYASVWEMTKAVMGIAMVFYYDDWFGAGNYLPVIKYMLAIYFFLSLTAAIFFSRTADTKKPAAVYNSNNTGGDV